MATSGDWQKSSLGGMDYYLLLPDDYSPDRSYPVLLYLHASGQEQGLTSQLDPWFNASGFRAAYPAIIVAPVIQGSSLNNNWGGFPDRNYDNQNKALAILQSVMARTSGDSSRVYVTGGSIGGYGTWDLMIKYNVYNGTQGRIFAAGMPLAGAWSPEGNSQVPGQAIVDELRSVPIWSVVGQFDPTKPAPWSETLALDLGTSSAFHLTEPPVGHEVWDTTYPLQFGKPYYDWMFSQAATSLLQNFTVLNTTTNETTHQTGTPYSGPVPGLTREIILVTDDNVNVTAEVPNVFIHTGSGKDAISVATVGGNNVMDGSTGSNFLVGGAGHDTFFVDDRSPPADIWSTVVGFHGGDGATIWGVTPQDFRLNWVDGEGAAGFTGLTLHATAGGRPTASLTLAGFSTGDLSNGRLTVSFGQVGGNNYMFVQGN